MIHDSEDATDPPAGLDPTDLRRLAEWRSQDILFCIARAPGDPRLLVGSSDFGVDALDPTADKPQRQRFAGTGHHSYVTGLAIAGGQLISGSYDRQLIWWDLETGQQRRVQTAHDRWIRRLIASPDGKRLYSVADDMTCRVWDAASGESLATLRGHATETPHGYPSMLYAVAVSPDGRWLAAGDRVGHVAVWDTETFQQVATLEAPTMYTWDPRARRHSIGGIRSLAFSPAGTELAVGGIGKIGNIDHLQGPARVEIFRWREGERLQELEDETRKGLVEQMVWMPDGKRLLTVGGDHKGFLTFYDVGSGELLHQEGTGGHLHGVAIARDWQTLAVAGHQSIAEWTLQPPEEEA